MYSYGTCHFSLNDIYFWVLRLIHWFLNTALYSRVQLFTGYLDFPMVRDAGIYFQPFIYIYIFYLTSYQQSPFQVALIIIHVLLTTLPSLNIVKFYFFFAVQVTKRVPYKGTVAVLKSSKLYLHIDGEIK